MAIASGEIIAAPRPHGSSPWTEGHVSPRSGSRRGAERRGRAAGALAAGLSRRRHRGLFRADHRAALVGRPRRDPGLPGGCGGTAPDPGRAHGRDPARAGRRRFRADPVRGMAGWHADARPSTRLGRADRTGHRYRSASNAAGALSSPRTLCPVSRPTSSRVGCASASRRPATRCSPAIASGCAHGSTRRRRRSCRAAGICSARCISPASVRSATASDRPAGSRRSDEARGVGWRDWLLRLRNEMTARINAALPGSTGGVASALITGKRGTMSEEVAQGFRDSGLAHLLAISGLHLALVGGFVFLDGARRPGADPVRRAALPDQEDRGRSAP